MDERCKTALPGSTQFVLTVPHGGFVIYAIWAAHSFWCSCASKSSLLDVVSRCGKVLLGVKAMRISTFLLKTLDLLMLSRI